MVSPALSGHLDYMKSDRVKDMTIERHYFVCWPQSERCCGKLEMYKKETDFPAGFSFITTWYLELLEHVQLVTIPEPCIRFREYGSVWRTVKSDVRDLRIWLNVLTREWRSCVLVKVNRFRPLQGKGFTFCEDDLRCSITCLRTVAKKRSGLRSDNLEIIISQEGLVLINQFDGKAAYWSYFHIRSLGKRATGVITVEVGREASTGPGLWALISETPEELYGAINKYLYMYSERQNIVDKYVQKEIQ